LIFSTLIENLKPVKGFFCLYQILVSMKYVDEVKPQTIVELFKKDGIHITTQQAKGILEFMYMLADFSLEIAEKEIEKNARKDNEIR